MWKTLYFIIVMFFCFDVYSNTCRPYEKEEHILIKETWVKPDTPHLRLYFLNVVNSNESLTIEVEEQECQLFYTPPFQDDEFEDLYRDLTEDKKTLFKSQTRCPYIYDDPERIWYTHIIDIPTGGMPLGSYDICLHSIIYDSENPGIVLEQDYAWIRIHITENLPPTIIE
jgi:hypothetical protein